MPTEPITLIGGLRFPEAPRWREGRLWFSDMLARQVRTVDADGTSETQCMVNDMPGGLGFLPDGTALVAGMTTGKIFSLRDGVASVYGDLHEIAAGHLDDMSVAADGTVYAGGVGMMDGTTEGAPLGGCIISLSPDGATARYGHNLAFPNGSAVTSDGRTLLVNETFAECVSAFDIAADGTLGEKRIWARTPGLHPDGLALDSEGAAWIGCYPEGVFVRVLPGGDITDRIEIPGRWTTGVALGGSTGRTLFLCSADTSVERFFRGDADGRIDTVEVAVPAPISPTESRA